MSAILPPTDRLWIKHPIDLSAAGVHFLRQLRFCHVT